MNLLVGLEGTWEVAIFSLLIPSIDPFPWAERSIEPSKFQTICRLLTLSCQTLVILNVAGETVPCLISCREPKIGWSCFYHYLHLRHSSKIDRSIEEKLTVRSDSDLLSEKKSTGPSAQKKKKRETDL